MTDAASRLKNLARGGGTFHQHRLEVVRNLLENPDEPVELSEFLRDRFLKLVTGQFQIFHFGPKDWELCERLLQPEARRIEPALISLATQFIRANATSVARLYALNHVVSGRLLSENEQELVPESDLIDPVDAQSLFAIRIECAVHSTASDVMRERLETRFAPKSWPRLRLIYPLLHYFVNRPRQSNFDNFLSYMVTGREHETEKLTIKLLLSDEAARTAPLAFKTFVGMMGHAYDTCEFVLDHIEQVIADGHTLDLHLLSFLRAATEVAPGTRSGRILAVLEGKPEWRDAPDANVLEVNLPLSLLEAAHYSALLSLEPTSWSEQADADRPYAVLANMRVQQYPEPRQFQRVIADQAVWFFTDGAKLLAALLRTIYMVDREDRDLETRDVIRLIQSRGA